MADLTEAELWRSVDVTVSEVLLPAIGDDQPWAIAVAVQLIGLARYAARRPSDRAAERVGELLSVLDALATNEIIAEVWDGDRAEAAVIASVGRALAACVTRADDVAAEVRRALRPVVVRQLDDELVITASLVDAFRGRLDD